MKRVLIQLLTLPLMIAMGVALIIAGLIHAILESVDKLEDEEQPR